MKFLIGLVVLALACTSVFADITNTKLLRNIDLSTQFERHALTITAENKGASSITSYSLAVQNASHLAYIKAETENGESVLEVTEGEKKNEYVGSGCSSYASIMHLFLHVA
jgi:Ribophorin I